MGFYVEEIVKICNANVLNNDYENIYIKEFCRDTRTIKNGDIYVAIKGENFDGNKYVLEAVQKGAVACIIDDDTYIKKDIEKVNAIIIKVSNTIEALQNLASAKRKEYDVPVIAITGSVGKTSTKDIVYSVMCEKYNTLKTEGNLNNDIGLPLTLLRLDNHNAIVVEMGMNNKGEISKLTKIGCPTLCVITNIGTSHIGNLGSRQNILNAKLEILEGLKDSNSVVINNDNDMLNSWANEDKKYNKITYGIDNNSKYMAKNIILNENNSKFDIEIEGKVYNIFVPVGGKHFVYNALCSIAVGRFYGIEMDSIIKGIGKFELTKQRMDIVKIKDNITVINDSYNASYDSMKAGIEYLSNITAKRRIAVLGDMLELGEYSEELHKKVGDEVLKSNIDILITVGQKAKFIASRVLNGNSKIKVESFDNNDQASIYLNKNLNVGDILLLKASNSMKFCEILNNIK